MSDEARDANGISIRVGDTIVLETIPPYLTKDLPSKDVLAIEAQIGSRLEIVDFDSSGYIELEFGNFEDSLHTIFLPGRCLSKAC
jgi:hypothetical protein